MLCKDACAMHRCIAMLMQHASRLVVSQACILTNIQCVHAETKASLYVGCQQRLLLCLIFQQFCSKGGGIALAIMTLHWTAMPSQDEQDVGHAVEASHLPGRVHAITHAFSNTENLQLTPAT